jgi:eukaryotic-like serine/threonine-protein kinase
MVRPAEETSLLATGDVVLDRYRVIEQIAAGGHSLVFRGEDTRLARPVCIKVFSGLGGKSGVGRTTYEHFVQEAFALSRLTHPNTLRIYDFGHLDVNKRLDTGRVERPVAEEERVGDARGGPDENLGLPLQVCEYMNGGTLSTLLREKGPQSIAETLRIVCAMCEALAEAHNLGIVHRDIKPQNILFASVGDARLPKLADFGIAKWSADRETDSSKRADDTQIVAGQKLAMYSPSWAAPEQLAGQPVGPSTDIYSLAALAVYMLTGKAIFSDEDVYAGYKKRRQSETLVGEALGALVLPSGFTAVLAHALAFDPKERTTRIADFSSQLSQAAVPEPVDDQLRSSPYPVQAGAASGPVARPSSAPLSSLPSTSWSTQPSVGSAPSPEPPEEVDPSNRTGDPLDRLADGTRYRVYGGLPSGPTPFAGQPYVPPAYVPPAAPTFDSCPQTVAKRCARRAGRSSAAFRDGAERCRRSGGSGEFSSAYHDHAVVRQPADCAYQIIVVFRRPSRGPPVTCDSM